MRKLIFILSIAFNTAVFGQNLKNNPTSNHGNKFEQLGTILPDGNQYRTSSGAPGKEYWQQKANYKITAYLNENTRYLHGYEEITYINNSPDNLTYVWLQLDENEHNPNGESNYFNESNKSNPSTPNELDNLDVKKKLAGYGMQILEVSDIAGNALKYTINNTMMRIDLKQNLMSKSSISFKVKWTYKIPEKKRIGGRGGYEFFEKDGSDLFTISQWYPRMCVYSDYQGWNHKQFTGRGEFSLVFGDFDVTMITPKDHIVASTGECQNYSSVLTAEQIKRWQEAQSSVNPKMVVTLEEAIQSEKNPQRVKDELTSDAFLQRYLAYEPIKQAAISGGWMQKHPEFMKQLSNVKTWKYQAKNVRDFAWGSSRKFTWDAMPVTVEGKKIMCMSYYPKESYHLYSKYSTKVVAHTIKTYSKYTIPYAYPVAISVEAASGMEYPMICFNYGRTEDDGTYTSGTKYGMIGVIIHEVGHNFFPMIINSDERNWSWMDEGLNTFVQFLTEQEFDNNYPSRRGPAHKIVDYMKLPKDRLEPIMTNSEEIIEFGPNAYAKPATALNILRETVMGRELFDYAFKEYCRRWAYKHPSPSDLFRTMEDASGVDLDWFWRAWFYDIEPVDVSLDSVTAYKVYAPNSVPEKMDTIRRGKISTTLGTPAVANVKSSKNAPSVKTTGEYLHVSRLRNKASGMKFAVDTDTTLRDFYFYYDEEKDTFEGWKSKRDIDASVPRVINRYRNFDVVPSDDAKKYENRYYYELTLKNVGGAVTPVIIQWTFTDGTTEVDYINAYIWRKNEHRITKNFVKDKEVKSILVDPFKETADIDESNNVWPKGENVPVSRIELFKMKEGKETPNPMQRAKK